jgi:polycystin 1L2
MEQVTHDGNDHWVLIAKGFSQPEHILFYDSLPGSPWYSNHILSCMSSLLKSPNKEMTYIVKTCQRQSKGYDCGVFAIAFAASLANGEDPSTRLYDPKMLRPHLIECFSNGKFSQFPSTASHSTRSQENETIGVEELYCNCRITGYK